jgi:signal transduction histidine kinase
MAGGRQGSGRRGGRGTNARGNPFIRTISWAAEELLLREGGWEECVEPFLERLAQAVHASGARILERTRGGEGLALRFSCAPPEERSGTEPLSSRQSLALSAWSEALARGECLCGTAEAFPAEVGEALRAEGIASLVIAPVFSREEWWGGLGLYRRKGRRQWSETEIDVLRIGASLLGAAIGRARAARGSADRGHEELEARESGSASELLRLNALLREEIVERRRSEEALAHKAEVLARSNAELEQFAYVASHDLQQPLVAVIGFLKLLEQRYAEKLDSDGSTFISRALDGANRMQVLIRDLLEYSRAGARGEPLVPVDCGSLVDAALSSLKQPIEETGAVVTWDPLPTVWGVYTRLSQIFQNLISNAIKFTREKPPRVHVSAERRAGEWVFFVRDNGIGIEARDHERIFRAFERLHGRSAYPGTGIGLAICKKAVEYHGGRLEVESQPGRGSVFSFTVPDVASAP